MRCRFERAQLFSQSRQGTQQGVVVCINHLRQHLLHKMPCNGRADAGLSDAVAADSQRMGLKLGFKRITSSQQLTSDPR